MKELVINSKTYAQYEIEGTTLYIKMTIQIIPGREGASENFLIKIIQLIENVQFQRVSYLNV